MEKNKKLFVILLVIIIILIATIVIIFVNKNKDNVIEKEYISEETTNEEKYTAVLDDGIKLNTSEEFNRTKMYNDLEISNIQFTEEDGMSILLADVKNTGTTKHELEHVNIKILGENGNVLSELEAIIEDIEPGETVQLNTSTNVDITNAKDFEIEAME